MTEQVIAGVPMGSVVDVDKAVVAARVAFEGRAATPPAGSGGVDEQRGEPLHPAFASDGRTLATASADQTVRLWDLTGLNDLLRHPVERACSVTYGGLDRGEWARYIPGLPYQNTCPS